MRVLVAAAAIAFASPVSAATLHGLVYDDANHDGVPSPGEPGIANAVVALDTEAFVVTDRRGQFDIEVPDAKQGIVWVRVPEGFRPGPVWAPWKGSGEIDLGLQRLPTPIVGPFTFVVASDTHIGITDRAIAVADLSRAAHRATEIEPAPAFFTILGDITQGSRAEQYAIVDEALADLGVPWIPVPGNHDWYDGGAAWFGHYGPDNYSFDLGGVHFVVWNMALAPDKLAMYLGAELRRVPATMPVVALTHDPPRGPTVDVLRELGVDYVLTGHTHSNRIVDHGGVIELNTEPFLMGGLDFTPAGYRVVTIDGSRLMSYHRTVVDEPYLAIVAPRADDCASLRSGELLVAAELSAGASVVSARVDCATEFELRSAGGWLWRGNLPALSAGEHVIEIEARAPGGETATIRQGVRTCTLPSPPAVDEAPEWTQVGGTSNHTGSVARALEPPLVSRWVAALGNHVLTSAPIIADGAVYVATTDLADGNNGGVVAVELATGAIRWRVLTPKPIRGGVAYVRGLVITTQIDGEVLALDAATGAIRWRRTMSKGIAPQAGAVFSPPAIAGDAIFLGHQRAAAALAAGDGTARWTNDPIPEGFNSQSAAAIAIGGGLAVGTFQRELGGLVAWDAKTGSLRWRYEGDDTVAINAAPVIGPSSVFFVSGTTDVVALDLTGKRLWRTRIDGQGFAWGSASVGTPALAKDTLIVPTLYGSLVALDAKTGAERWRYRARPGPLRGTHYYGGGVAAFAASPVVAGDVVWAADTSGLLSALDLATGLVRWYTTLPSPVMAGLAVRGDWLVVASYDGTLRAMTPDRRPSAAAASSPGECPAQSELSNGGCCRASGTGYLGSAVLLLIVCALVWRRRALRVWQR